MPTDKTPSEILRDLAESGEASSEFLAVGLRLALSVEENIDRERAVELLNEWPELVSDWRKLEDLSRVLGETVADARARVEAALKQRAK